MKNTEPMQNELEKIQNNFQVFMRKNVEKIGFDEFIEDGEIFKNFDEAANAYCEFLNGLTTTDTIQTLAAIFKEKSGEFCRLENAHDSTHAKALTLFLIFTAQKFADTAQGWFALLLGMPNIFLLEKSSGMRPQTTEEKAAESMLDRQTRFKELFKFDMREFLDFHCPKIWAELGNGKTNALPFFMIFDNLVKTYLAAEIDKILKAKA